MKKKFLIIYGLLILGLLIRAEIKTWPLLESNLGFTKLKRPVVGATLTYDLSSEEKNSALSNYRENPERQGIEKSSLTRFQPFQLKWRVDHVNNGIHRASKSSPAVDDSGFYIADDTGYLRAYDPSGRLRWQFYDNNSSRGLHSTPLTDQDTVYIGDYAGYLYALNKDNGRIRWVTQTGITIGSSPFMHEGRLYVGVELADPDGFLLSIDARTGEWHWTSALLGRHPHSSPALDIKNKSILMGANSGVMTSFDLSSGKTLWTFATKKDIKCSALIHNDVAYFVSWDGFLYAINSASGVLRWKAALDDGAMSCPSISSDGKLVAVTGYKKNFVVATASGQIAWTSDIKDRKGRAQSSPLVISYTEQDVVIFLCENQAVCVHDLKTGHILQQIKMESEFSSSPVYRNQQLYLSTSGPDGLLIFTQ